MISSSANGVWGNDALGDGTDVFCVRAADFDRTRQRVSKERLPLRSIDSKALSQHMLRPGDLILEKSGGGEKQPVGMAVIFDLSEPAVCSNFCSRLTPAHTIEPRFLSYSLAAAYSQGLTQSAIKQTTGIQNLDAGVLFSSPWAYPEIEEQRRIADFLDVETSRIDRLIERRSRQLSLLAETEISRAYAAIRGESVEGPRQFSGLQWLGDIPSAWRVAAVSHLFEVELGKMLNQERVRGTHLRPYLRCANVQWDEIALDDLLLMDFSTEEQPRYRLRKGDLLVCEGGSWPGRAAIWQGELEEIYYQKALHRLRSRGRDLERWLFYCLLVAEKMSVFAVQGNSSTITHLTREQLKAQRFPFPEPSEQAKIVRELDAAKQADSILGNKLRTQSAVLHERRRALIAAAVTGQIDIYTVSGRGIED
ncbi:restriction endonuclease subunit S [Micromonospora thermarum]|nr:restriction endonuclease subunit S [Micromonospora thermarum]